MTTSYKRWQKLFLFALGIFIAAALCMKWMEGEFKYNGNLFTIIGLEISYSKREMMNILSGIDAHVQTILRFHLSFDFVFMLGVYPGIASLCMMGAAKTNKHWVRTWLKIFAILQLVAWGCDIAENSFLLGWMKKPDIGGEFMFYHLIVYIKWGLALSGALLGIIYSLRKNKNYPSAGNTATYQQALK